MPIQAACPRCDRIHTLADDLLGARIRCKGCDVPFRVEEAGDAARRRPRDDDEDDRPRRRRDRDDDDSDRPARPLRQRSSGASLALIIGLIVGGIVLVVVVTGIVIGVVMRAAVDDLVHDLPKPQDFPVNDDAFRIPGMPPANSDWNQLQKGMTFEQIVAIFGEPSQDHTFEGLAVKQAGLEPQEAVGADGRPKPVRRLIYFKGHGQFGLVNVILVDGKFYKLINQ
jgi:hypothetical protein